MNPFKILLLTYSILVITTMGTFGIISVAQNKIFGAITFLIAMFIILMLSIDGAMKGK